LFGSRKPARSVFSSAALILVLQAPWSSPLLASPTEPDWSQGFAIGENGRANPYQLNDFDLSTHIRAGRIHALQYPIEITGVLLPYEAMKRFIAGDDENPLKKLLQKTIRGVSRARSFSDLEAWLGLAKYPDFEDPSHLPFFVPFPNGQRPEHRMGVSIIETQHGPGFTISCAQCHSDQLFGRPVMGMSNRFPRANRFFDLGLKANAMISTEAFRWSTSATAGEVFLFERSKNSIRYLDAKVPAQLGLDTSLAQVALSLAKRARDGWATRIPNQAPRKEKLAHEVADSKPAVWWNVKYKNRFLSDGSVVSGNPILTNFLWNEIGRGTDLHQLNDWLNQNPRIIRELTTAVMSAEAPHWTDFFAAESLPLDSAKRGQKVYQQHCSRCHGTYEKAWDMPDAIRLSLADQLKTTRVIYNPKRAVVDVGTDPQRYRGMKSLEQLNRLVISQQNGIRIEAQRGYVPPPLVGIWARWPYFHNNSAPSLCAVLTPGPKRPVTYWARPAIDPQTDFDAECNGYPATPPANAPREHHFDTRREGLSNRGHDERILLRDGEEILSPQQKRDLIRYLQTL